VSGFSPDFRRPVVSGFSRTPRPPEWYCDAMRTTIDKAGRVVIPAAIRDRAGLIPGSELEITEDETGVRLERVASGPRLVKVGRRLVARPQAAHRPTVDIAAMIEDERNRWP
jgi:AbrB family looped-hinge helix DNA binding protein